MDSTDELWAVATREWRLPLRVTWSQGVAAADSACEFSGAQHTVLRDYMTSIGAPYRQGRWYIPAYLFRKIASQQHLSTEPQSLILWGEGTQPDPPRDPDNQIHLSASEEKFLKAFWHKSSLEGLQFDELIVLWHTLMKFMADWIINKERVVDFGGFFEVSAVPYRSNWKNILTAEFLSVGAGIRHKSKPAREHYMAEAGVTAGMLHPFLMWFDPKLNIVRWTLEVRHKKLWWKNTIKREQERRRLKSPSEYAKSIQNTSKLLLQRSQTLFAEWLSQIARPCAEYVDGRTHGSKILRAFIAKKHTRPSPAKSGLHPNVVPNDFSAQSGNNLAAAITGLPQMSNLQPDIKNLRNPGGKHG